MSGSIAPSAADLITFGGTSDVSQAPNPGSFVTSTAVWPPLACACDRNAFAASADNFMSLMSGGAMSSATNPAAANSATKVAIVATPRRPIVRSSLADATPTNSSETTSGTIVMRIALTHSCPIGSSTPATRSAIALSHAAIALPKTNPAMRPMTTR